MTTLANYITDTRRLLHDATGNYWSDSELTDYINDGRFRVVSDTGCNRVLQTFTIVAAQELYTYASLPSGALTIDILNVTVIWGSLRIALNYYPFTKLNNELRAYSGMQARPIAFSIYGQGSFYVAPVPDQNYSAELDTVVMPATLINSNDVETIVYPYTSPVAFYAAYKAKYKEQSYQESDKYLAAYRMKVFEAQRATMTRRIPSQYPSR